MRKTISHCQEGVDVFIAAETCSIGKSGEDILSKRTQEKVAAKNSSI